MSGIIKKVDELGRIVIPKDIRKNLNIKSSDDIEIVIKEEKIELSKYYKLKNFKDIINEYKIILDKFIEFDYFITDKESIILTSKKYECYKDEKISNNLMNKINERKILKNDEFLEISNNLKIKTKYNIYPIIINTDILGSIVFISNSSITDKDELVAKIFLLLLNKNLE